MFVCWLFVFLSFASCCYFYHKICIILSNSIRAKKKIEREEVMHWWFVFRFCSSLELLDFQFVLNNLCPWQTECTCLRYCEFRRNTTTYNNGRKKKKKKKKKQRCKKKENRIQINNLFLAVSHSTVSIVSTVRLSKLYKITHLNRYNHF